MTTIGWRIVLAGAALVATVGPEALAQGLEADLTFNQSFTSVRSMRSPTGFRVGLLAPVWGRFGVRAGFSSVREPGGEIPGYCGLFCVTGPFDSSYLLRTLAAGASYALAEGSWGTLTAGVSGSASWQHERLNHLETGEVTSHGSVGPDLGVGAFGDVRIRPLLLGLRPVAYVQYDRIGATNCVADASCFGGRNLLAMGVGLGWQIP